MTCEKRGRYQAIYLANPPMYAVVDMERKRRDVPADLRYVRSGHRAADLAHVLNEQLTEQLAATRGTGGV